MTVAPHAVTLHVPGPEWSGKTGVKTIRADCVTMVTEEYSRVDNEWVKSTFVYTANTFFEVKETRTQVLKLLGWDPVMEVNQHEKTSIISNNRKDRAY